MRLALAIRTFLRILTNPNDAKIVEQSLFSGAGSAALAAESDKKVKTEKAKPKDSLRQPTSQRSAALTLLATLQREARFIDFLKEELDSYSNEQVGAVARDVHRDCRAAVDRLLDIHPISSSEEGADIDVPTDFHASRWRLTGDVHGDPPFRGKLAHHGWEAGKCDLPNWSGPDQDARVLAPVEVEIHG